MLAGILAGYPLAFAADLAAPAGLLAGVAIISTLVAVVRRSRAALALAVSLAGAEYVLLEVTGHVSTVSVPAYGAGLLLLAEALLWHAELPSSAAMDAAVLTRWLRRVALAALAGAAVGAVVLLASPLTLGGATTGVLAGSAAALLLIALPLLLLRRQRDHGAGR